MQRIILFAVTVLMTLTVHCQVTEKADVNFVKDNFTKIDTMIRMRDGIKLYTVIYIPKDKSEKYPFLMERTPYSSAPYGDSNYSKRIGPNPTLMKEKYIFVYQDVRGRYRSEGINLEVTPIIPNKKNKNEVDECSDTYDTVDWLLKNISNNNGRVGVYGISYPGFYAVTSLPGAHPAIKAVSPQAPVTDEFIGDDVNHRGAFFLMDNFNFMNYFGKERTGPTEDYGSVFKMNSKDMYQFFLQLGPVKNSQSEKYFNNKTTIWNEYLLHDTYDDYWKARNTRPHLKNIAIPTLVVGGWFDAEDLFGALETYKAIENGNPANNNRLVMGPWTHGAWESSNWNQFASYDFGSNTSKTFQDSLETGFFNYYLKDKGNFNIGEATVFETGSNKWKSYTSWPPQNVQKVPVYLGAKQQLLFKKDASVNGFDEYLSDPNKPVPYTNGIYGYRNNDYMVEDQRFAAVRPDVLVYETDVLTENVTLAGSILADLRVSITGTDADFVVKLIDVLPDNEPNFRNAPKGFQMAGYQRLVRAEVLRGKFRNSYEKPEPFEPGKITSLQLELNDVAHTFRKGHKMMIQVQSSWFPLVDRNPQKFIRIPDATENDFQKATIRIYHDAQNESKIVLPVLLD
ncbi:MAG: CocE/NonD family hydrolase [Bacteroidetes bacterium]|nr:CocE/NonD family hydrolase [Bacteroidota bacterium]